MKGVKVLGLLSVLLFWGIGVASAGVVINPFIEVDETIYGVLHLQIIEHKDDEKNVVDTWWVEGPTEDCFYPGEDCPVGEYVATKISPYMENFSFVNVVSYDIQNSTSSEIVAFAVGISEDMVDTMFYLENDPIVAAPDGWKTKVLTADNFNEVISGTEWEDVFSGYTFASLFPGYKYAIGFGLDDDESEGLGSGTYNEQFLVAYGKALLASPVVVVTKDPDTNEYSLKKGETGSPLSTVPEPATSGLCLLGLAGIALLRERR